MTTCDPSRASAASVESRHRPHMSKHLQVNKTDQYILNVRNILSPSHKTFLGKTHAKHTHVIVPLTQKVNSGLAHSFWAVLPDSGHRGLSLLRTVTLWRKPCQGALPHCLPLCHLSRSPNTYSYCSYSYCHDHLITFWQSVFITLILKLQI